MTATLPPLTVAAAEHYAGWLAEHPDYRVLRRFVPRDHYAKGTGALLGLYVDVEATGLDTDADEIMELAIVPFRFNAPESGGGTICEVLAPHVWFEEPKSRKISAEITELTGITPEMVAGQSIDTDAATRLVRQASLVIAHNADYDRRMGERRIPAFANVMWACSQREVPWKKFGVNGGALQNILMSATGEFCDDAHRAATDCQVGIHVLAAAATEEPMALSEIPGHALNDGCTEGVRIRTAFSYLIDSARAGAYRVCAINSPYDAKEILRARKYHAQYIGGRFAYWYKEVDPGQVEEEMAWCREEAYAYPQLKRIPARDRYSLRADR